MRAGTGLLTTTTMTGFALLGGMTQRRSFKEATSRVAPGPVVPPGKRLAEDAAKADMSSSILWVLLYISSIYEKNEKRIGVNKGQNVWECPRASPCDPVLNCPATQIVLTLTGNG
jgi:hypothetical protein